MNERPILFSGAMVRAILDGRKTMTRRVVKPQPTFNQIYDWNGKRLLDSSERKWCWKQHVFGRYPDEWVPQLTSLCPYGKPGDTIWAKETFFIEMPGDYMFEAEGLKPSEYPEYFKTQAVLHYRATPDGLSNPGAWEWRPSIFMPRWASRINLLVKSVTVQRLQDISNEDCAKEGIGPEFNPFCDDQNCNCNCGNDVVCKEYFQNLWDSINAKKPGCSWADNPWVWAIEFEVQK